MNIRLDPARFSARADLIEARAGDMRARRAEIEADVDALLAVWNGRAAERFAGLWTEWRESADVIIAGLATSSDSLRQARDLMTDADATNSETHGRLTGRLG